MVCKQFGSRVVWRLIGLAAVAAVAIVGGIEAGLDAAQDGPAAPSAASAASAPRNNSAADSRAEEPKAKVGGKGKIDGYLAGGRWREGSKLVDIAGRFKTSGERVAFHSADGKSQFPCLENLNSERIARIVAESPPDSLEWIVHGTLTEFRNENYLLVTQAVISSQAIRGPRASLDRRVPEVKGASAR